MSGLAFCLYRLCNLVPRNFLIASVANFVKIILYCINFKTLFLLERKKILKGESSIT